MNLLDFVQLLFRKKREGESFLRDPRSQLSQDAYRRAEQIAVGQAERMQVPQVLPQKTNVGQIQAFNKRSSQQYQAIADIREKSGLSQQPTEKIASSQLQFEKDFLQEGQEIQGRRERYRIIKLLKDNEWTRTYYGTQRLSNKPVWIKEYIASKRLGSQQIKQQKEQFEQLARINLTNSRKQDFRLITPFDTIISDNCYYLITDEINGLTLREYLKETGAIPASQVRQVLIQVLQTLWFLHNQKIRLPSGEIKQADHGNLSLDSLLVVPQESAISITEPQFLIYVCDLGLWEDLFKPKTTASSLSEPSATQDLKALGYVGFNLLTNAAIESSAGEALDLNSLDPGIVQRWSAVGDRALKQVIWQLLGLVRPAFANAFTAREALLKPLEHEPENLSLPSVVEETATAKTLGSSLLLTLLALGIIAGLGYWGARWLLTPALNPSVENLPATRCQGCLSQVLDVPTGKISYVVEAGGSWSYALNQSGLVSSGEISSGGETLMSELKRRDPRLQGYIRRQFVTSPDQAIEQVRSGQIDFALISVIDNNRFPRFPVNLQQETVAYDALAVFVANGQNIPDSFNRGKITFEQLRQLYTNTQPWDAPDRLKDWLPRLYVPFESRAIDLFAQKIFQDTRQNNQYQESLFANLKDTVLSREKQDLNNSRNFRTMNLFGEPLEDIKDRKLGIGFAPLSMVFGQCSVYPLAVGEPSQEVQPLIQKNDQPINPSTDLCNSKGNYYPSREAIASQHYPLAYSLVVIYPKDKNRSLAGQKFVELLKTDEGQCLMNEAGLVPLHPCPKPQ